MSTANVQPRVEPQSLPLHRFSTSDYLQMIDTGVLGRGDKVELIDGIIVSMSPSGSRHNHVVSNLTVLFAPAFAQARPSVQGTLSLVEGQVFDPDFMLLRQKLDGYKNALPAPADVMLLIEVSESSLRRDRDIKLPIYAAAGVREYWIVDIDTQSVLVHRNPTANGYTTNQHVRGDESISPQALPDFGLTARDIFA